MTENELPKATAGARSPADYLADRPDREEREDIERQAASGANEGALAEQFRYMTGFNAGRDAFGDFERARKALADDVDRERTSYELALRCERDGSPIPHGFRPSREHLIRMFIADRRLTYVIKAEATYRAQLAAVEIASRPPLSDKERIAALERKLAALRPEGA
jgi:hypothetical protein